MAGKSWQTSHEDPSPQGRTGTHHTDKTMEKTEGEGRGKNRSFLSPNNCHANAWLGLRSKSIVYSVSTWNLGAWAQRDTAGRGATLALFVVNSVKLHLT